jgi:hypothetical protein
VGREKNSASINRLKTKQEATAAAKKSAFAFLFLFSNQEKHSEEKFT